MDSQTAMAVQSLLDSQNVTEATQGELEQTGKTFNLFVSVNYLSELVICRLVMIHISQNNIV